MNNTIKEIIKGKDTDLINENANTNGRSPMGIMSIAASEAMKNYARTLVKPEVLEAFDEGYIHIHDFDFYATGTTTCCQLPIAKLLSKDTRVGECIMRPAQSIGSAMALAAIYIQTNQNVQHGGQAIANFDFDLEPYVFKSYMKLMSVMGDTVPHDVIFKMLEAEVDQACEAFIHNCNSLQCRNGMQVPFTSINFGLDTSAGGRMISKGILRAQMKGLGDGSTPIFPILVFKYKTGVNANPEDPNYDIYQLALECQSKRLFPNFLFMDSPFNAEGYVADDPTTHVATMGCRTRVYGDIHGESRSEGRGNLSFTTLNLPMIAQEVKDTSGSYNDFLDALEKYFNLVKDQLLDRYHYQQNRPVDSFKFLYKEGVWHTSDNYSTDVVGERLKTGSLSVGFVGLAEALVILTGYHHGQDPESQNLGLDIVRRIREECDKLSDKHGLNFSLLATPAESYCGKALRQYRNKYGIVEGVSDRDYFTNSNHIPVHFDISAKKKIELEAPYHELTNAGHIMYVELDGAAASNTLALDDIVKHMAANNVGYGSINHPVDRCRECGNVEVIADDCRLCGSRDISRVRRITGYLVGDMDKWNTAKTAEESERVKHGRG